jgi:type VI secretion system secreted protein VgrG
MVVANTAQSHTDLGKITYETMLGGKRPDDRIYDWQKSQELRSGKYTLWDHNFELPHKHLETDKTILETAKAGKVDHKLKVGGNDKLEIYDYPGEYSQRFDGIDRSGGEQASELQKIFEDNKRTVEIRMQEEAVNSLIVHGGSNCRQLISGHKFSLEKHFNADGQYVLTSLQHSASMPGAYRSDGSDFSYHNSFTSIPIAVPYRPQRRTPKPFVQGTQSAVVVGPKDQEIYTDKYSRVKVQFHWDREGKYDGDNCCWSRVTTYWAGKQWGAIHIPRVGQEVVVAFEEGDPDQPIIVGSVYNADMMPPYKLPDNKTQSGIKSRSSPKGTTDDFNEIRFEDKKGSEEIYIHAEQNLRETVEYNETVHVYHNRTITTGGSKNNKDPKKDGTHTETIEGDAKYTVQKGDYSLEVQEGQMSTKVKKSITTESTDANILLKAKTDIKLECGASSILLKADGTIEIKGKDITINGTASVGVTSVKIDAVASAVHTVKGAPVKINC